MTTLGILLVRCAAQVTLLSLAAVVVYLISRRLGARAAAQSLLTGLVLVLVLSLLAASPWPQWQLTANATADGVNEVDGQSAETTAQQDEQPQSATDALPSAVSLSPASSEQYKVAWTDYAVAFVDALARGPVVEQSSPPVWPTWLAAAGLVGVAVCAIRLTLGFREVRRLLASSHSLDDTNLVKQLDRLRKQLHLRRDVDVRQCEQTATPATIGWRRPTVLLPARWREWNADELQAVLAHELAHVAGRDFAAWVVAQLAVVLHFYNPLVRWLARRLQLEQELAADAVAASSINDSRQYLRSLASLALSTPAHRMAGPARTFFPSRSLLLRRVEMLRSPMLTIKNRFLATRLQWAAACLLAATAIGVAGLRQPPRTYAQSTAATTDTTASAAQRIPMELIPANAIYAVSVQPAALAAHQSMQQLVAQFESMPSPLKDLDITLGDIAEFLIAYSPEAREPRFIIRTTSPEAADRLADKLAEDGNLQQVPNGRYQAWRGGSKQITKYDASTLVMEQLADSPAGASAQLLANVPAWASYWNDNSDKHLLVGIDVAKGRAALSPQGREQLAGGLPLQMIAPLLDDVLRAGITLHLSNDLEFSAQVNTTDGPSAQRVADTLKALMLLGKNMLDNQSRAMSQLPPQAQQHMQVVMAVAQDFLQNAEVSATDSQVRLSHVADDGAANTAITAALVLPAIQAAREAARRTQGINNLKQLGLALHNYADAHGHFPAAKNYDYHDPRTGEQKRSQHPHSWRVAILPYLELANLQQAYRYDEPWDSEANKKLLAEAPAMMHDPSDAGAKTNASYFALVGKDTTFPGDQGSKLIDIHDGTSITFLLVEARRDIPWTKPEDIPYAAEKPVPALGGNHPGIFLAAYADGSVQTLASNIDAKLLRAYITRNGGENIRPDGTVTLPDRPPVDGPVDEGGGYGDAGGGLRPRR